MLWRTVHTAARGVLRPLAVSSSKVVVKNTSSFLPKRLLHHQQKLPALPVPPLQQTLNKFLLSVRPLLNDEEYQHAEDLVARFGKDEGIGEKLQKLLEKRASETDNWLSDWWINIAYLEFRSPVTIHVSPGISSAPQEFRGQDDQLMYASRLVSGILNYKKMIEDGTLPFDKLGNAELCMSQFYNIVSCCRIPRPGKDETLNFSNRKSKNITVFHNNHIFSVPVYGTDGSPLSVEQIQEQLRKVVNSSHEAGIPIGLLTADHRDNWSKAYIELCKDPQNKKFLEEIHSGLTVLCLDQPMPHDYAENRLSVMLRQFNHGGGSHLNSGNRWADKILQIIVGSDGSIGSAYEHSTAEGPPVLYIMDKIIADAQKDPAPQKDASGVEEPIHMKFNINATVSEAIEVAGKGLDATIDDLQIFGCSFEKFGKGFMKQQKCSPDAFIQLAFQLAFYKMYGRSAATYESGSLRKYKYGRTDTIRSCSIASHAYCQAMCDPSVSANDKANLLREAITSHRKYTDSVINGQGIDRHLLGLKLIALEHKMDIPELLMDPVYSSSCHWQLSTSQVASKTGGLLAFAPVVPDGYGICYNPMEDKVMFGVSAWNSCPETDATKLRDNIMEAFSEAQEVLIQASGSKL